MKLANPLVILIVFLLALAGSLAYFKPEYAVATLVGLGAFAIVFGALVFGKIKLKQ